MNNVFLPFDFHRYCYCYTHNNENSGKYGFLFLSLRRVILFIVVTIKKPEVGFLLYLQYVVFHYNKILLNHSFLAILFYFYLKSFLIPYYKCIVSFVFVSHIFRVRTVPVRRAFLTISSRLLYYLLNSCFISDRINLSPFTKDFRGEEHIEYKQIFWCPA